MNKLLDCEHLCVNVDFGKSPSEDFMEFKCNILKEKFLFFFTVRKKCDKAINKEFHKCDFYKPEIRGNKDGV